MGDTYIPPSSFVHRHVAQVENDGERYHRLDKTTALRWLALDRLNSSNLRDVVDRNGLSRTCPETYIINKSPGQCLPHKEN